MRRYCSASALYYNLDSQSAANAVSANVGVDLMSRVTSSGRVWTPDDQSNYDRAHDSAVKAGIFYGVGGAVLIGAVVTLIVTQPKDETTIIHPHSAAPDGRTHAGRRGPRRSVDVMMRACDGRCSSIVACSPDIESYAYLCGPEAACPDGQVFATAPTTRASRQGPS